MSSVRALIVGHGDFASGLLSAVVQITGRDDVFVTLTNRGLSAQDVERTMREEVELHGLDVVFTDLPAGSATMAARRIQRVRPELVLVMGTNLATLLDFVFASDDDSPAAAAKHAVEKGRAALVVSEAPATGGGSRGA
ncbi:MAG: hypothetical protein ABIT38_06385 [Gemmatimonadaceae bacterium]